jgi:hypothetical protein
LLGLDGAPAIWVGAAGAQAAAPSATARPVTIKGWGFIAALLLLFMDMKRAYAPKR